MRIEVRVEDKTVTVNDKTATIDGRSEMDNFSLDIRGIAHFSGEGPGPDQGNECNLTGIDLCVNGKPDDPFRILWAIEEDDQEWRVVLDEETYGPNMVFTRHRWDETDPGRVVDKQFLANVQDKRSGKLRLVWRSEPEGLGPLPPSAVRIPCQVFTQIGLPRQIALPKKRKKSKPKQTVLPKKKRKPKSKARRA